MLKVFQNGVLLLIISTLIGGQDVGSPCRDRYTSQPGTCKLPEDCPGIREKAEKGITPTICSFKFNTISIVCCEELISEPSIPPPQANENSLLYPDNSPEVSSSESSILSSSSEEDQHPLSKIEKKCAEFSKFTVDTVVILPLLTVPNPTTLNVTKCEYDGVPLIVGGKPAAPGEFPFMAAIGFSDDAWKCGGTLISDNFVLTAAHCARSKAGAPVKVRLGDLNLAQIDDTPEPIEVQIIQVIVHPEYKAPRKYNDIALLKLAQKVTFTQFLRPACLWTKREINQPRAIATGWGTTSFGGDSSDNLLKVALDILDNTKCSQTFGVDKKSLPSGVLSSMLCAGELKGNKDTCQGDSGGPLLITQNDNNCLHYIVGITSFGRSCGAPNTPAIYTRVSDFASWLEKTVWP